MSTTSEDVHWGDMLTEKDVAASQQSSAPTSHVPAVSSTKSARTRNSRRNKSESTQQARSKPMASGRWAATAGRDGHTTGSGGRAASGPSAAGTAAFPSLAAARTSSRHTSGRTTSSGSTHSTAAGPTMSFHGIIAALRDGFGFIRIIPSTVTVPADVNFPVSDDMFFHFSQVNAPGIDLCPGMEVTAVASYKHRKWSAMNVEVASSPYAWVRRSDRSYIGVITSPARGPRTVLSAADSQLVRIAPTAWKAVLSEPEGHVDVLTALWATRHTKGDVSRLHGKSSSTSAGKIRILLPSTAVQEDAGTLSLRTDRLHDEIVAEQGRPDTWAGCSWLGRSFPWGFDGVAFDATPGATAAAATTPRSTAIAASWMPGDIVRVRVATDARTGESWATDIERIASLRHAAQAFAASHPEVILQHRAAISAVESAAAVVAMPKQAGTGKLKIPLADLRTGEHSDAAVRAGADAVAAEIVTLHLPAAADRLQATWGSTQSAESLAAAAQEALDWSTEALSRQAEGKTPGTRPLAVLLGVQLLPNAAGQTHAIAAQLPGVVLAVDAKHRGASLSLPTGALLGLNLATTAAIRGDCELSVWLSAEELSVSIDSLRVGDLFMLSDVQVRELSGKVEARAAQLLAPTPALREYGVINDLLDGYGFITPLTAARATNDVYFHASELLGVAPSETLAALATGHWQAAASASVGLPAGPAWDSLKPGMLVSFETAPSPVREGTNKPVAARVQVLGTVGLKVSQARSKDWKAAAAAASKSLPKLQTVVPAVTGTVVRVDSAGTKGTADAGVFISVQLDERAAQVISEVAGADPQQFKLPDVLAQGPLATWRLAFACGLRYFPAAQAAPGASACPSAAADASEADAVDGKPSLNALLASSPAVTQHDLYHAITRTEKRSHAVASKLRVTRASIGEFIVAANGVMGAAVAAASALRDAVALPSGMAVALAMGARTSKYSHANAGDVQQLCEASAAAGEEQPEPIKFPTLEGHTTAIHASLLGVPCTATSASVPAISIDQVVSSIPPTASACLTPQAAAVTVACGVQTVSTPQATVAIPAGEYWVPCLRADTQTVLAPLVGDTVTAELCIQTASGKVRARNVHVTHSVAGAAWASGGVWGEVNASAGGAAASPVLATPDAPTSGRARGIIQAIKNGVALVQPEWPIPGSTVVFPSAVPGGLGEIPPGTEIEYMPEPSDSGHSCTDVQPLPRNTVIQQLVSTVLYIGRVVREPAIPLRGRRPFGKASAPYATGVNAVVEVVRHVNSTDTISHELAAPWSQGAAVISQVPWLCAGIQPQVQAVLDGMTCGSKLALSTQHCVAFDGRVPPLLRDDLVVFRVGIDVASSPTLALPLGDAEHIKTCCATAVQILQPMEATRRRGVILRVTEAGGTLIQIGQLPASQFARVLAGIDKLAAQHVDSVSASTVSLAKSFLMTEQAAHYPVGDVLKFSKQHVLPSLAQAASATQQGDPTAQLQPLTIGDEVDLDIIRFGAETPIRIVLRTPRHGPIPTLVHQGETGEAPPATATAEEVLAHALHMQGVSTEGLPHALQYHPVIVGPDVKFRRPRPAPVPGEKQGKTLIMTRPRFNAKIKQRQNAANVGVVSKDAAGPPRKDAVGFDRPRAVRAPRH